MDHIKLQELLEADRPLTIEEQSLLHEWYDQFPQYDKETFMNAHEKERIKNDIKSAVFKSVIQEPAVPQLKTSIFRSLNWNIAAGLALLVVIGSWLYWKKDELFPRGAGPGTMTYSSVTAPAGKIPKLITLPDSSKVWLMAGSTLRYPQDFNSKERTVALLNGMALFEVTPDQKVPFSVTIGDHVKTTVLGTSFNISAFDASDNILVTVVTGKVTVSDREHSLGQLVPNEQIVYAKKAKTGKLQQVDAASVTSWITGNIVFSDANFEEVASVLENVYSVKILYNREDIRNLRFNFRISKQSTLTGTLDMIRDISELKYDIKDSMIRIF